MRQTADSFLPRSRSGSRSRSNSIPQTPNTEYQRENSFPISQASHATHESRKRGRSNRSRSNSALGATTVMAGIIAGSVAGWSPVERSYGDNDSMRFSRPRGQSDLENRGDVEIHSGIKSEGLAITQDTHHFGAPPGQIEEITPALATGARLSPPHSPPRTARKSFS